MEINPVASNDVSATISAVRSPAAADATAGAKAKDRSTETKKSTDAVQGKQDDNKDPLSREDMEKMTDEMTKFMESLNTDIQFSLHQDTGRLIVKVVDKQTDKVLKEFPPHQLLDTMAAISKYIGGLLDKKV
ncbi:MAG: flagellar protein FlaG [Firmicutes bacterium]|nr:flagellar protein FlaG [Bacillota bacterium]